MTIMMILNNSGSRLLLVVAAIGAGAECSGQIFVSQASGLNVARFGGLGEFSYVAPGAALGAASGATVAIGDYRNGAHEVILGASGGSGSVAVFNSATGQHLRSYTPFGTGYTGGISVAAGDFDGDGTRDVVASALSGSPGVKVLNGRTGAEIASFFAFNPGFLGGVRLAAGDMNGDGVPEIIAGAGPGAGPQVSVFDGASFSMTGSFFAFDPGYSGGVFVAAGHVGGRDVIVASTDAGVANQVSVFDPSGALVSTFRGLAADNLAGGRVGVGDGNADGQADILITTGPGPVTTAFAYNIAGNILGGYVPFAGAYSGGGYVAGAITPTPVPEPAATAALGGILALGFAACRRFRSSRGQV